jgi:hypothetical protein
MCDAGPGWGWFKSLVVLLFGQGSGLQKKRNFKLVRISRKADIE